MIDIEKYWNIKTYHSNHHSASSINHPMKQYHNPYVSSCIFALAAFLALLTCSGCKTIMDFHESSVTPEDLETYKLAHLIKAIEDGDAETVSESVHYPLPRPAPLPPIENSEEFIAYFPIIFDNAFRRQLRKTSFTDSWIMPNSWGVEYYYNFIRIDGTLKSGGRIHKLDCCSETEKKLRRKLMEEDRKTLCDYLQNEPFTPVLCFETTDGKTAGRIDELEDHQFRIALFNKPVHPGDCPYNTFKANIIYEGRQGSHSYLDCYWQCEVAINMDGPPDAPEMELLYRVERSVDFGEPRAAVQRTWQKILESQ